MKGLYHLFTSGQQVKIKMERVELSQIEYRGYLGILYNIDITQRGFLCFTQINVTLNIKSLLQS